MREIQLLAAVCVVLEGVAMCFFLEKSFTSTGPVWLRRIFQGTYLLLLFVLVGTGCRIDGLNLMSGLSVILMVLYQDQLVKKGIFFLTLVQITMLWNELLAQGYGGQVMTGLAEKGMMMLRYGGIFVLLIGLGRMLKETREIRLPWKELLVTGVVPVSCMLVYTATGTFVLPELSNKQVDYLYLNVIQPVLLLLLFLNVMVFFLYRQMVELVRKTRDTLLMDQQMELQKQHYLQMEENQQEIRGLRHDLRNHLEMISYLLETGEIVQAKKVLQEFSQKTDKTGQILTSGNPQLDSILNCKREECRQNQVPVYFDVVVPAGLKLTFEQGITILGNLLDNAMEENKKLLPEQRSIRLQIRMMNEMLCIQVSNPCSSSMARREEAKSFATTKQDPQKHGFGLINVERCVKQAGGTMEILQENQLFRVSIVLYQMLQNESK